MAHDPLANVDVALLLSIPRLTAKGTASLSRSILVVMPDNIPDSAHKAADVLQIRLDDFDATLARLRRELGLQTPLEEVNFDTAVDGAWVRFRRRLQDWQAYSRPGFKPLAQDPNSPIDYGELIARAEDARLIEQRLFNNTGVNYLRSNYPEQAESMRSILRLIDEDQFEDRIEILVGDDVLPVLRDLQIRYDAMVQRRAQRSSSKDDSDNLRSHQLGMQRALRRYASAMYGLYDETPQSGTFVYRALLPILTFRERLEQRTINGEFMNESEDEMLADLEAQFAEQEDAGKSDQGDPLDDGVEP